MPRNQIGPRKFRRSVWLLMGCLLVLTILGAYFFATVLDQARIGSQRYQTIIDSRGLEADAQVPPLRLTELQLAAHQLSVSGEVAADSDVAILESLEAELRQAYDTWDAVVANPDTAKALATARDSADDYLAEVDGPFMTAAQSGDAATMAALLAGPLDEKYLVHEAAVDDVARVAAADAASAEVAAHQSLQKDRTLLLLTVVGLGLLAAALAVLVSPRYSVPVVRGPDDRAAAARSLHRVVGGAVELAKDQSRLRQLSTDMLVYFGRRNHERLTRGLTLVSDLDRVPTGTEATSQTARLLILMKRLRRDSERMLVLAGEPSMRSWADPVTVLEAVEIGLSEVDAIDWVQLELVDAGEMPGAVASDLSLLISELVDDAFANSLGQTCVSLKGRPADGGGYELRMRVDGPSIEPQQLGALNDGLANGELDWRVSGRVGLSVVAKLACRNHIEVSLSHRSAGRVTVRVWLPPACWVAPSGETDEGLTLAPMGLAVAMPMDQPERLPCRVRGASLDESLRNGAAGTVTFPDIRRAESVRTTLSALAMGQLAASEDQVSVSEKW